MRLDEAWWYAAIPVCGMMMAAGSLAAARRALRGEPDTAVQTVTLG
jgi:TRAP-type C4-dicarboxylate transport system permease small subunit